MVLYEAYNQKPVMEVKVLLNALSKSSVLCIFRSEMNVLVILSGTLKRIKSILVRPCIAALVCTVTCLTLICFEASVKPEHSQSSLSQKR